MTTFANAAVKDEKGYYWAMKTYPHIPFSSASWGTEEEIIFSRAVAKFQDLIIMEDENG